MNVYILADKQGRNYSFVYLMNLEEYGLKNITLVVKNVEDWEKLKVANEKDVELGGKILIPWFNAEQIYAIPNNINIFVFGADEYCGGKKSNQVKKKET